VAFYKKTMLDTLRLKINRFMATQKGFSPLSAQQYAAYNRYRPEGVKPIFCYLPFNSLTFSMSGQVFVCNYNKNILLGRYPENTIEEIWTGAPANTLREHMRHNDLTYGCNHCQFYFDKGKFTNLRPLAFDKYSAHTTADYPRVMEFELSNECNLECQMCNGNVSSSIRKNQDKLPPLRNPYNEAFVEQLLPYLPHLQEAKFYGGEPFLIPIYYAIWEKIAELNPACNLFLITNGSHWNTKIQTLVEKLNLDIAISIDSLQKERLEKIRKNIVYEKLMENIERFNRVVKAKGKTLSLSFTVQQENWPELPAFIRFCNEREASVYVSYLDSPKAYAISELSKVELQHIVVTLSKETFPLDTALHRHNAQCLQDFLTYVNKYITNANEPQYEDYFYGDQTVNAYTDPLSPVYVRQAATRQQIEQWLNDYISQHPESSSLTVEQITHKLEQAYGDQSPSDQSKLYGMILQSDPPKTTIEILNTKSIDELRALTLPLLPRVVLV
jgi:MoaA/NifB/PqqE/SkfB family radical SAM enzyme